MAELLSGSQSTSHEPGGWGAGAKGEGGWKPESRWQPEARIWGLSLPVSLSLPMPYLSFLICKMGIIMIPLQFL